MSYRYGLLYRALENNIYTYVGANVPRLSVCLERNVPSCFTMKTRRRVSASELPDIGDRYLRAVSSSRWSEWVCIRLTGQVSGAFLGSEQLAREGKRLCIPADSHRVLCQPTGAVSQELVIHLFGEEGWSSLLKIVLLTWRTIFKPWKDLWFFLSLSW
jgi:hypothetical protein